MGIHSRDCLHVDSERATLEHWARRGELYALVDPFFDLPSTFPRARLETRDTDIGFFEAIAWERVTYEPPYLVSVDPQGLRWLLDSMSTDRWGIFVASTQKVETLVRHFQKFVIARGPKAEPYFLRFHDAAVLEVLLKSWPTRERAIFFGPVLALGLPDLESIRVVLHENPYAGREWKWPRPEACLIQLQEAQLEACAEAIDRDLVRVIYWHLRNHHYRAVQFLDRIHLYNRIRCAIVRARSHGLATISDLAGFAALMFELAPNFDEHPTFRRVLEDEQIPPGAKLKKLSMIITDREWEEALRLYDRTFWSRVLSKNRVG